MYPNTDLQIQVKIVHVNIIIQKVIEPIIWIKDAIEVFVYEFIEPVIPYISFIRDQSHSLSDSLNTIWTPDSYCKDVSW